WRDEAGSGGSSSEVVMYGATAEAWAALVDIALEKPGTMAMTRVPSMANRLAWAQWRRVQRPLKPAGSAADSPCAFRAAARRFRIRIRCPRPGSWGRVGSVMKKAVPARREGPVRALP